MNPRVANIFAMVACGLAGCVRSTGPYAPQTEASRDSLKAQALTEKAAAIMDTNPARAETLLREALTADIFFGPAHNDLGVLMLKRGELYSAASEFEWCAKLLPNHPDPRMNLGLTLEKAGRTDEALSAYASVLDVTQGHMPTIEAMTRLQIKSGKTNERTHANLQEIAFKSEGQTWRDWARSQLAKGP